MLDTLEAELQEMQALAEATYESGDISTLTQRLTILPSYHARLMGLLPDLERQLNSARGAAALRMPSGMSATVYRDWIASQTADQQCLYSRVEKLAKNLALQVEALRTLISTARKEMELGQSFT